VSDVGLDHILMWFASFLGMINALCTALSFDFLVGAFQGGALNAMTGADSWFFLDDSQNHSILRPFDCQGRDAIDD